ncbi:MAG: haloalkane dehalogenase [Mycobacterium sp.]
MSTAFTPDPTLYPFTSRWFDSSRGRMHYVDEGSGPPLLLCHGNPTWSFLYRNVIIELRDRFRCIAVDNLGFGLSERPRGFGYTAAEHVVALGEFVDRLGLDGYLSMGQDWGGPISLGAALDRADRVAGVILHNTWFWPADAASMKVFSAVMSSPPLQYAIRRHNFFVNQLIPAVAAHRLTPQVMAHYRGVQPTPADRVGVARLPREIVAARPLLQRLADEVPTTLGAKRALIFWGMRDPAFRPGMLKKVRAAFADHVFVELPRASHYIQEDAPHEIAQAISERFG